MAFHIKYQYSCLAKVLPSTNTKLNVLRNMGFIPKLGFQKLGKKDEKNISVIKD